MNNRYFAQFLLNTKHVDASEMPRLLTQSVAREPSLAMLALRLGALAPAAAAELMRATPKEFAAKVAERGWLTGEELDQLSKDHSEEDTGVAQALYDIGRYDCAELSRLFRAYDAAPELPSRVVMRRIAEGSDLVAAEVEQYGDFAEFFLRSFGRFMHTPVVIDDTLPPVTDISDGSFMVSQRLQGDFTMVTGMFVLNEVALEMARRYSQEDLQEVNEMVHDSLLEFLNVVNGLLAVDFGRRERDIDLETPKLKANVLPVGTRQLQLPVETSFGAFTLITAADEFIPSEF